MNSLIKTIFFCFVIFLTNTLIIVPTFSQSVHDSEEHGNDIITDGKTGVVTNAIEVGNNLKVFTVVDVNSNKELVSIPSNLCDIMCGEYVIYQELKGKRVEKGNGKQKGKKICEILGIN